MGSLHGLLRSDDSTHGSVSIYLACLLDAKNSFSSAGARVGGAGGPRPAQTVASVAAVRDTRCGQGCPAETFSLVRKAWLRFRLTDWLPRSSDAILMGMDDFHCSFCQKRRREVRKLMLRPAGLHLRRGWPCATTSSPRRGSGASALPRPRSLRRDRPVRDRPGAGQEALRSRCTTTTSARPARKPATSRSRRATSCSSGPRLWQDPSRADPGAQAWILCHGGCHHLTEAGYVGEDVDSVIKGCTGTLATTRKGVGGDRLHRRSTDSAQGGGPRYATCR